MRSRAKADFQISLLQRASKLRHPNLLRLLPGGRCRLADMDFVFVLMEYAEEDLGYVLPNRSLTEREARDVLGPLLDALNYIHNQGIAHSHIKPSNIMAIDGLKLSSDTVLPLANRVLPTARLTLTTRPRQPPRRLPFRATFGLWA